MKRRQFLKQTGSLSLGGSLLLAPAISAKEPEFRWKMATTWPRNAPGFGMGANYLVRLIEQMSGGRIKISLYGAKELVAPLEVFDAVASGDIQMGHGAAFYWTHKIRAAQLFAAVPFGLTAQEMNAWLYQSDGLELWRELYADFDLIPAPCGNTGVQMGGWFNREITRPEDFQGLRMRIPGLGGEVIRGLGGEPVLLPGGEIFSALQKGDIDAAEWAAPYNDVALGLYKVAKYYYYPGWHEPGTTIECLINRQAMERLPQDLRSIVEVALQAVNQQMLAEFTAKNHRALQQLVNVHQVSLRRFPDSVLSALKQQADQVMANELTRNPQAAKIYHSYQAFREQVGAWSQVSEVAYLRARELPL